MTTDHNSLDVRLHDSQALIQIINANVTYCAWQRGGGKTGGGIGPRIQRLSQMLPRSQHLLFSDTYERLQDRIVPNIIEFQTNKLGMVEGLDFVLYKKPPDHWPKPIFPLNKFDKVISYSSGFAVCLVSLHIEGSANAFNAQSGTGDEIKYCDEEKIDTEVLPALRGCEKEFSHLPEYLSVWMFTDKYGPKVKWFLRKKKLMNKQAVEIVYTLQMEIFKLQQEQVKHSSSATFYKFQNLIDKYKMKADKLRKNLIYFSDMKPYENLETLTKFYFKRARRIAKTEYVFNVAYLNHDPDKIEHTYYPTFTNYNKHQIDNDYDPHLPFITALDYQFRISPMPMVQISPLPGRILSTVNFVDAPYVLDPLGLEDVVNQFCKKYSDHLCKEVHYIYDHTAIGRNPMKTVFKDVVVNTFEANGWDVIEHYTGEAPDHDIKFENLKPWLLNRGEFSVMVNEITCDQMIRAIEQTPATTVNGVTKKDKKTEKDKNFPAEDSTHFPDAFDQLLIGLFEHDIIHKLSDAGFDMIIGK